jgi:hypothetical protein
MENKELEKQVVYYHFVNNIIKKISRDMLFISMLQVIEVLLIFETKLDEADALTQDAMMALRIIMEEYTEHTRFCLLCNYPYKIIQPIKSRCLEVYFPDTIDYRKQEIINKFGQETIIPIDLIIDFLTDSTDSTIKTIYHSGYKPMNFLTTLTQYILKEYNPIPQGIFKCISKMEFNIHCGCNFYIQLIQLKHKLQKIIS